MKPSRAELSRRASAIRLVVTDVDGVLTDTGVYYTAEGEVAKRFSIRDGMGVELLRAAGIETAIMTGETSGSVVKRAEKLRIERTWLGVKNKGDALRAALLVAQLSPGEVAYIGDDVNDLGAIELVSSEGLTGAPRDAMPAVASVVHHRARADGGYGAFRDFAEWILHLRSGRPVVPRRKRDVPVPRAATVARQRNKH